MEYCSYFLKSKSRNCRSRRTINSKYCHLHNKILKDEVQDGNLMIPCHIDKKHLISANKFRSHIRKCSKIRDIAYELSQPFCIYNSGLPEQFTEIRERIVDYSFTNCSIQNNENLHNNEEVIKKKIVSLKKKLEYLDIAHCICEYLFGENPHTVNLLKKKSNSKLNRHKIQAICIARKSKELFFSENENFLLNNKGSLVVEFGAGNAILSHFFIKEMKNHMQDSWKLRSIIIDRESRRRQMEKIDDSVLSIRLRLDIELFDFNSLIKICNDESMTNQTARKKMYSSLNNRKIPWIIIALIELGVWLYDSKSKPVKTLTQIKELDTKELKYILSNLSRGGGPEISKIEELIINHFISRPIKDIFIISKHLCGSGFDLGLKSALSVIESMNAGSKLRIIMSPCCHHKCMFSQHLGVDLFNKLFPLKQYFKDSEECFEFMKTISSWFTATEDWRNYYGIKAKFILDSCRLYWLSKNQFNDINFTAFTEKNVTPENVLITCTYSVI